MSDRNYNRDRSRFYDPDYDNNSYYGNETFYGRGNFDYDNDYDYDYGWRNQNDWRSRDRGYGGYNRGFNRGGYGQYGQGGSRNMGYNQGGYGRGSMNRGYGRGSQGYDRNFNDRGFDYDTDYFNDQDRFYNQGWGGYGGGYGRSQGRNWNQGRYGQGSQSWNQNQGYGRSDYGTQGDWDTDFDEDFNDYDIGPTWSYTEIWMIPGPFSGVGPEGYNRSDDRIREDIHDRLTQHGQLNARNIQVQVNNGEVTLNGTVDNRNMKRMAEDVAESVAGVRDVHNQLKVQKQQRQVQGSQQNQQQGQMQGQQQGQMQGQSQGQQQGQSQGTRQRTGDRS